MITKCNLPCKYTKNFLWGCYFNVSICVSVGENGVHYLCVSKWNYMHKGKCNEYASVNIINNFYLQGLYMAIFIQLTHTLATLFVSPTLSRFHWPIKQMGTDYYIFLIGRCLIVFMHGNGFPLSCLLHGYQHQTNFFLFMNKWVISWSPRQLTSWWK